MEAQCEEVVVNSMDGNGAGVGKANGKADRVVEERHRGRELVVGLAMMAGEDPNKEEVVKEVATGVDLQQEEAIKQDRRVKEVARDNSREPSGQG